MRVLEVTAGSTLEPMTDHAPDISDEAPIRVVIVDDVEAHRVLCALAIDATPGMLVVGEARDGVEACELVEALQPDALVLDLRMPVLDGFEAIPLVRTLAPHLRIVVWSGTAEPDDIARAKALGAHAAVGKFTPAREIADAVRDVVRAYRETAAATLVRTASMGALLHQPSDVRALRPWVRRASATVPAQPHPAALPRPLAAHAPVSPRSR